MLLEAFEEYINKFDLDNLKIKMKHEHSYVVMKISIQCAKKLGFTDEEVELAKIIGLLHDIGRFKQLENFNSFNDTNMDHGDYGADILIKDKFIRKFVSDNKNDSIIYHAIKNHNKEFVEKGLDDYTLKFCHLIRDADKLGILYDLGKTKKLKYDSIDEKLSEDVMNAFINRTLVTKNDRKRNNDFIACFMAFIFDINYDIFIEEMEEYISLYFETLKYKSYFDKPYELIKKYVKERIG